MLGKILHSALITKLFKYIHGDRQGKKGCTLVTIHENAPHGKEFFLRNGRILKNLHELNNALHSIDSGTFQHHVTDTRNDFASWIRQVFMDENIASQVHSAKSQEEMYRIISNALRHPSPQDIPIDMPPPPEKAETKKERKQRQKETKKTRQVIQQPALIAMREEPQRIEPTAVSEQAEKATEEMSKSPAKVPAGSHIIDEEQKQLLERIEEILVKEKEISHREQKIQEIEERIERQLETHKGKKEQNTVFFSKEFVQGIVAGFLITLIGMLIYIKFIVNILV